MKKQLLLLLLVCTFMYTKAQIIVQSGLGIATSGFIHPITEMDAGWGFPTNKDGHTYQATVGWVYNPYNNKTVYSVKGGININKWTLKAGLGLVNQSYTVGRYVNNEPRDGYYVSDTYISAYNTLILGAERYIEKWAYPHFKVYYGVDMVDGYFYAKMGFRFKYNVNNK